MPVEFIIGGARSGKSARALAIAESRSLPRIFIATAEACDAEMRDRITRHQTERKQHWTTIEAPLDLADAIALHTKAGTVCLVDCLTLWLSNVIHARRDVEEETNRLYATLENVTGLVILVSNEVGMGLVPETPLGRHFRDAQGRLNQQVAKISDRVEFVAAGIPVTLKCEGG